MNLSSMLREREAVGRPVRVGLIGAGKFGTMFLAQARLTAGMHIVGVADLDVARARRQLATAGWDAAAIAAPSLGDALTARRTHVTDDAEALIALPEIDVIVEATGIPGAGIRHALSAIAHGKHIVMVNVEADALAGPLLARKAQGRRRRLQPGVGRPAGADLRACRLGAHLRLQSDRRRQGHPLRAALSPVDARHAVGHPRQVSADRRSRLDQSENVQQLRRRHQVRHRDDGGLQRHRPGAAEHAALAFRPPAGSNSPTSASRWPPAARWRQRASPRWCRRSIAKAAMCRIISRSAPMWCSRARANTRAAASKSTPCCPTAAGGSRRCTGRFT